MYLCAGAQEQQRKLVVAVNFHCLHRAYHCFTAWRATAIQSKAVRRLRQADAETATVRQRKAQRLLQKLAQNQEQLHDCETADNNAQLRNQNAAGDAVMQQQDSLPCLPQQQYLAEQLQNQNPGLTNEKKVAPIASHPDNPSELGPCILLAYISEQHNTDNKNSATMPAAVIDSIQQQTSAAPVSVHAHQVSTDALFAVLEIAQQLPNHQILQQATIEEGEVPADTQVLQGSSQVLPATQRMQVNASLHAKALHRLKSCNANCHKHDVSEQHAGKHQGTRLEHNHDSSELTQKEHLSKLQTHAIFKHQDCQQHANKHPDQNEHHAPQNVAEQCQQVIATGQQQDIWSADQQGCRIIDGSFATAALPAAADCPADTHFPKHSSPAQERSQQPQQGQQQGSHKCEQATQQSPQGCGDSLQCGAEMDYPPAAEYGPHAAAHSVNTKLLKQQESAYFSTVPPEHESHKAANVETASEPAAAGGQDSQGSHLRLPSKAKYLIPANQQHKLLKLQSQQQRRRHDDRLALEAMQQEIQAQQNALADLHCCLSILRRCGMTPWMALLARSHRVMDKAVGWRRCNLMRAAVLGWKAAVYHR